LGILPARFKNPASAIQESRQHDLGILPARFRHIASWRKPYQDFSTRQTSKFKREATKYAKFSSIFSSALAAQMQV
jgi:hypothetical protein